MTSPGGFIGNPQRTLKGVRVSKMINEATSQINESSNVLRNTLDKDKESSHDSTLEKQLRTKYVLSWNELAIAYQQNKMYSESLEAFQTAIQVYQKLNLKIHSTFAQGDYFISKLHLAFSDELTSPTQKEKTTGLIQEELMSPMDHASELNVYVILSRAVYNYVQAAGDSNEFQSACDQI